MHIMQQALNRPNKNKVEKNVLVSTIYEICLTYIYSAIDQGYVKQRLESSLRKFDDRHHKLVDHYGISISQMTIDLFA